jgi:hypothetical protein
MIKDKVALIYGYFNLRDYCKSHKRLQYVMLNLFQSRTNFGKTLKQVQSDRKKTFAIGSLVGCGDTMAKALLFACT